MSKEWTAEEIAKVNEELEGKGPEDVIKWALDTFGQDIAMAWSGAEDVAVVDMMMKVDKTSRVFTLDTGR
ncbi:MAG: phosphoadenylyl-sulfate reductase, partial [Thermodesulfobacteriota bacterium]